MTFRLLSLLLVTSLYLQASNNFELENVSERDFRSKETECGTRSYLIVSADLQGDNYLEIIGKDQTVYVKLDLKDILFEPVFKEGVLLNQLELEAARKDANTESLATNALSQRLTKEETLFYLKAVYTQIHSLDSDKKIFTETMNPLGCVGRITIYPRDGQAEDKTYEGVKNQVEKTLGKNPVELPKHMHIRAIRTFLETTHQAAQELKETQK